MEPPSTARNPDLFLPSADNFEPRAGATITALAAAAQVKFLISGKPKPHMIRTAHSRPGDDAQRHTEDR